MTEETITVEVAYATPEKQKIISLTVSSTCTAREAVEQSGMNTYFEGLDLTSIPLGVFGNALGVRGLPVAEAYQLNPGDRVEMYRPLIADPKEVRRQRAAEAQAKRETEKASGQPKAEN